jgi:hypothetical protein
MLYADGEEKFRNPAGLGASQECNFKLSYTINEEAYTHFNMAIIKNASKGKQRRFSIIGAVLMATGIGLFFYVFMYSGLDILFVAFASALILSSIISFLFYPFCYPRMVKRAVSNSFVKSGYKDAEITVLFDNDKITEMSPDQKSIFSLDTILGVIESGKYFLIKISGKRGLLIPKSATGGLSGVFSEYLKDACTSYELPYSTLEGNNI